ncbi:hypothetical protein EJV47_13130 [Hymenobacter gummosus]|uniref:T9SS type A sorting domain-containing protein n=2 Tax=Hymenobacter gummosus TaxID=1776032 RepID=A0A3S0JE72_9BACT|nr:hypothetical protein EJV47_13130 [Hymenobacter gummosus]
MSQHNGAPLKMMAVNFPVRVNIPFASADTMLGWWGLTERVFNRIRTSYQAELQSLNWTDIDARTNQPGYLRDNSNSAPDGQIDYTVVIWRYAGGSPAGTRGLDNVLGSGGGYASVPYAQLAAPAGTSLGLDVTNGFTQCLGYGGVDKELFTHEVGHTLYGAPHYLGANGVVGSHFYLVNGYGMIGGPMRMCANGWERWYLGWIPTLQASGVGADLADAASLTNGGEYTLRDFITTGDAVRIRLPNTYEPATGTWQYLWLENHQGRSVWDRGAYTVDGRTPPQPFPTIPNGIQAYVENMRATRAKLTNYQDGAGGIQFLSAHGNFDAAWDGTSSLFGMHLWRPQNLIYNFVNERANPTGGHNDLAAFRGDKNSNGVIGYTDYWNNTNWQTEGFDFWSQNGQLVDGFLGTRSVFNQVEQKIGWNEKSPPLPLQDYNQYTYQLSPIPLSGVSVTVTHVAPNGDITVRVRFDDLIIGRNTRWTGNLELHPGPSAATGYSLDVFENTELLLDKSGTPNRHTLTATGDFINPTVLRCRTGATIRVKPTGKILVAPTSTLFIEADGQLLPEPGSEIVVDNGGLVSVQTQADADQLRYAGQLTLKQGGRLEIRETGTVIVGRPAPNPLLSVYPNPANGPASFVLAAAGNPEARYQYRLLNLYGRPVREGSCTAAEAQTGVRLPQLPAGQYVLEVLGADGKQRSTRQVVVNP